MVENLRPSQIFRLNGSALFSEEVPVGLQIKDFSKFEKELKAEGKNLDKVFYYVFSHRGMMRFVFVTSEPVNWEKLMDPMSRSAGNTIAEVPGMLWDNRIGRFMTFSKRRCSKEYNWILYDCGIPHVIRYRGLFRMFFMKKNRSGSFLYIETERDSDPVFVSHYGDLGLKRAVFLKDRYGKSVSFLLTNELNAIIVTPGAEFDSIIYERSREESENEAYEFVFFNRVPTAQKNLYGEMKNFVLVGADKMVIKDTWEKHLVSFDTGISINPYGFFDYTYRRNDGVVVIRYALNDFENAEGQLDFYTTQIIG